MLNLDKTTWETWRFDQIAVNVKNRIDDPSESGMDRYVGLEHLDAGSMTVNRWGHPSDVSATKLVFQAGDVIFGRRRAYQKKVAQADFGGIASAHALVLRAKREVITERFLPIFLSSDYFLDRAISISVGSLSPTVNWRDLAGQEFALPPLDEQERIANLLWAVEEHRQAVNLVCERAMAAIRRAASEELAEATDRVPFRSLWTRSPESGFSVAPAAENTGREVLSLAALGPDGYRQGHYKPVPDSERMRAASLNHGDLLVSRANTVATVGRAGIYDDDRGNVSFPDTMMRIHLKPGIEPGFIQGVINSDHGRAHMERVASGTNRSMAKINRSTLGSLEIPNWDSARQAHWVLIATRRAACLEQVVQELQHLASLRTSVLVSIFGDAS